jgi:ABC-type multidrug transport system permease subunit
MNHGIAAIAALLGMAYLHGMRQWSEIAAFTAGAIALVIFELAYALLTKRR